MQKQKLESLSKKLTNWLKKARNSLASDILIVLLSLFSIILLIFELIAKLTPEEIIRVHALDLLISIIFLFDFVIGLYWAENRGRYFRHHWTDLIASIPLSLAVFRIFRVFRILRLVHMIRVISRIMRLGIVAERLAEQSRKYIYASTVTLVVIMSGAVAFFTVEHDYNPGLDDFFDAIWWSIVTISTVGYGDIYPRTWEGRCIAIVLMFFGIGLMGSIAGLVSSKLLNRNEGKKT